MRVPISWLKDYIKIEYPIDQLAHKLTMGGLEVGQIITLGNWGNCLVGLISEVNSHPNADNLQLCKVSAGNNEIEVVCGAPNVSAGHPGHRAVFCNLLPVMCRKASVSAEISYAHRHCSLSAFFPHRSSF